MMKGCMVCAIRERAIIGLLDIALIHLVEKNDADAAEETIRGIIVTLTDMGVEP